MTDLRQIDPARPFLEIDEAPSEVLYANAPGGFTLEIPVPGATVDELDVEVVDPFLILYRGGSEPATRCFVLLANVDTDSIRARLEEGVLWISARRRWTRPRRLPILSNFLWGGHVGFRQWELPPRRNTLDRS